MSRFNEIVGMIAEAKAESDLELIYAMIDDGCITGCLSDKQCSRIYDLLNRKTWN